MRIVALTGVPGTGKTAVAALLADSFPVRDALGLAREIGAVDGRDASRGADVVDEAVLEAGARRALAGAGDVVVVEGLVAHFADPDLVVVLRCRPDELRRRLAGRGWSAAKVEENVEAERLDAIAAEVACPDAYEIDTTGSAPAATARLVALLARSETVNNPRVGALGTFDFLEA